MRGLFLTGTDTSVGKSVVSAALVHAMMAAGEPTHAYKPVLTGLDETGTATAAGEAPADHELLGEAAAMDPADVAPLRFGPAVSPHLAAQLAGTSIDPQALLERAHALGAGHTLLVEGVGGLLVPLRGRYTVCDLAGALALPLVIVARSGLGTINHALLTLAAARAGGLDVRAVVLNEWPDRPGAIERSNRDTIAELGDVEVCVFPRLETLEPAQLRAAGAALPWRDWAGAADPGPAV